jgi:hypothetical protein
MYQLPLPKDLPEDPFSGTRKREDGGRTAKPEQLKQQAKQN